MVSGTRILAPGSYGVWILRCLDLTVSDTKIMLRASGEEEADRGNDELQHAETVAYGGRVAKGRGGYR
jgi:hypothetical protein